MRLRVNLVLTFALVWTMSAASPANAAIQISPSMPIAGIYTSPQGGFLLILEASNPACGPSGNQFNVYVGQVGMTADGARGALAAVLTAFALGKPIRVYFDPTIAGCPIQQVNLQP